MTHEDFAQKRAQVPLLIEKGRPRVHESPLKGVIRLRLRQKEYAYAEKLAQNIRKVREKILALLDIAEAYMKVHKTKESQAQVYELLRIFDAHKNIQSKDLYRLSVLLFAWDRQEDFIALFEPLADDECAKRLFTQLSYDTDKNQEKTLVKSFFSRRNSGSFFSAFIPLYIPKLSTPKELKKISMYMPFDFAISRRIALQLYRCFVQLEELHPR